MKSPPDKPLTPAEKARQDRQARLAGALRTNLRRRKAGEPPAAPSAPDSADHDA